MSKSNSAWAPTATWKAIQARAHLYADIRSFFAKRDIIEVETPLLAKTSATDPFILSIVANVTAKNKSTETLYLQTSPEFAMKRLLASGAGSIYQICKAFRDEESGRMHNPEFTILEWYRIGFTHLELMNEMDDFLQTILHTKPATRVTYQELFDSYFKINPHTISDKELLSLLAKQEIELDENAKKSLNRDDYLNLLMTHKIEPTLGFDVPIFVYDYPGSQAALAKIRTDHTISVAERFEVYIQGIELANGYHELNDASLQLERFKADLSQRALLGQSDLPIDFRLIAALENGLPDCAGVALGIDRLLMLKTHSKTIEEVLSFAIDRA